MYRQSSIIFMAHKNNFLVTYANIATFIILRQPVTILATAFTKTDKTDYKYISLSMSLKLLGKN